MVQAEVKLCCLVSRHLVHEPEGYKQLLIGYKAKSLCNDFRNIATVVTMEPWYSSNGSPVDCLKWGVCHPCQDSGDGDDGDEEGEGALAAFGCLRALSTVLDSVSTLPALFPQLEASLFPIMHRMLSTEGQDVFEEIIELVSYFTYFSPQVCGRSLLSLLLVCP